MNNTWNVYKIFNNGNRAKAPIHTFEYDGENDAVEGHFNSSIKSKLISKHGTKISKNKFLFVRTDISQERSSLVDSRQEIRELHMRVFRNYADLIPKSINTEGVLVFSKETDWKWAWCVAQAASLKHVITISPCFITYEDAQEWMNKEIEKL